MSLYYQQGSQDRKIQTLQSSGQNGNFKMISSFPLDAQDNLAGEEIYL